ncbi:hypothetical protein BU17DRAFT_79075 [Hysterangium stoloniferum]|nr:hypothetical protein BU17DRAFT_79075 [Hysterangium stoloniferum]
MRDLNMVGLMGSWSTDSGVEDEGITVDGIGSAASPAFDGGRDTGGARREMAATSKQDMGSSSVQEQARVRKDQGCCFRDCEVPSGETGSKTLHEYDGPQDDSTRQEMTSFLVHDKPNISLSAYTHNPPVNPIWILANWCVKDHMVSMMHFPLTQRLSQCLMTTSFLKDDVV